MSANIFERYEIKYLLSASQRQLLTTAMAQYMVPDSYGESTICNVYYDTPDARLIRASMEKPIYKEKLRMRSYGPAAASDDVFLELKKKYCGVVYKRRISLPQWNAAAYLRGEQTLPQQSQISREIDWCRKYYDQLIPVMHISYERTALFGADDPNFRITFDRKILWRDTDLNLTTAPYGSPLLEEGQSLMEIKTASAIPLWLCHLLSQEGIQKTAFSKYGMGYQQQKNLKMRGIICA